MKCPKCESENVTTQIIQNIEERNNPHGCLWWLLIGWWWWFFFTLFAFVLLLVTGRRKTYTQSNSVAHVCQSCGNVWYDDSKKENQKNENKKIRIFFGTLFFLEGIVLLINPDFIDPMPFGKFELFFGALFSLLLGIVLLFYPKIKNFIQKK